MILLPKFEPERVVRLMRRATLLMGVPTFYTRLLAGPALTREAAAGMRLRLGVGAAARRTHRSSRRGPGSGSSNATG